MSEHEETPRVRWLDVVQDDDLGTIAAIRDGGPDGEIISTAADQVRHDG